MNPIPAPDPWRLELVVVRNSAHGGERRALSRDVARGLLVRLRRAVYVDRAAFEALKPEQQHIVRMRALQAASDRPVVFSHFSAAAALDLPVLRPRLARLHATIAAPREGGQEGVVGHVLALAPTEVVRLGPLLVTGEARTVVDIAAAAPFREGVIAADAFLRIGRSRMLLEAAADSVGPRRAARRMSEVIAFGHPGAESAAESGSRCTLLHLGVEPPVLQHRLVLDSGAEVFMDMLFPTTRVGGEVDGAIKLLDPAISKDARLAVLLEKRREDAMRLQLRGLARWGWAEAESPERLRAVLERVGVQPRAPRAVLSDYAAAARDAIPRRWSLARR